MQLLEKVRWKNGVFCPHCKSKKNIVKNGHVNAYQNYICKNCNHSFTVRTGTVFSHSKIPLKRWFIAVISLDKCSIMNIAEKLGLYYHTAYNLVKKIRKSVFLKEMMEKLSGELVLKIEIDEMYITAGEKGNKNLDREPRKRGLKALPGRGTFEKDKPAIIVITERKHGKTKFFVPLHLNGKYIVDIFQNHIEGNIIVYHDDYPIYNCLNGICPHFAINHSNGEYADGDICTNNAENRFSLLRPFLQNYRGISKYNLQEYATLCQFFFNERRETHDPMNILMKFLEYIRPVAN
ncbi:conserved hypothetical protein [groundwater metagenome]|uniref:ISXO2-like transposase domain-containing protein n=1 Tax=groundwater metagenome TaxID=717931 RepID=A0A098ECL5_9ZZZZ